MAGTTARSAFWTWLLLLVAAPGTAGANETAASHVSVSGLVVRGRVETVDFDDRRKAPVRIVRGAGSTGGPQTRHEILTFGSGSVQRVAVIRGMIEPAAIPGAPPTGQEGSVLLRGAAVRRGPGPLDPFGLASSVTFDRIAEAVHAVESGYGTDLRMWRLDDLDGPQGPMQVSAAAAFDVGGGNRFDVAENMLLGRAYLARMYRRYGSWSDALAAYNWGPGNVDRWIIRGRDPAQLPVETSRYIERVLQLAIARPDAARVRPHLPGR